MRIFFLVCVLGATASALRAQEVAPGAMAPPPEHNVTRIGTEAEPEAPPSLPPAEIIQRFSKKEDDYVTMRARYGYRKTIRIQEFGPNGQPSGEFLRVFDVVPTTDGKALIKTVEKPESTLQHVFLAPEDITALEKIPFYPLTTPQLVKYDLKYVGTEQVDEINCYIFQVKPKVVERVKAYFEGIVWVDTKYLEVVKTYGRWVTDQGDAHVLPQLPFSMFETYRENVDGKYWFPNYTRSDDTLVVKELEIPMRIVIKWTDFKLASAAPPTPTNSTPTAPTAATNAAKPQ